MSEGKRPSWRSFGAKYIDNTREANARLDVGFGGDAAKAAERLVGRTCPTTV